MSVKQSNDLINKHSGWLALSPAVVFLMLYVAISLIVGDFYVMPITVALLVASVWAVVICRGKSLTERIETFSLAAGNSNILYMVWIFVLAGAFAELAKSIGAIDATVNLTLQAFPPSLLLPGIFVAACFISMSIGTSIGTIVALVPLVVELAETGGANVSLYVATVLGGAFFGDNLSFISDTTIAATRTQGCSMSDKFRANIIIALPAAISSLLIYIFVGQEASNVALPSNNTNWWLVTPYLVIILTAMMGINVTVVLIAGIVTALAFGFIEGIMPLDACRTMGEGIDSMGQLIIITMLAAGMLGMIKEMGGIDFMLRKLTAKVSGTRGGQCCIAAIVSIVNLCTANNTVAIITVGSISRDIAEKFDIQPRKAASLLDTCSCIIQCLIPYGAQTLLATSLAGISPIAPWSYLYYPWALAIMVIISIIVKRRH